MLELKSELNTKNMNTKKFTILHSNDMHGDFFAEDQLEKNKLIGGLSLLSGYINKVRRQEENVLYVISGDMVQGSIIDTEYKRNYELSGSRRGCAWKS